MNDTANNALSRSTHGPDDESTKRGRQAKEVNENEKAFKLLSLKAFSIFNGRGERIRTSDSCVPNAVLYQAELRPDRNNEALKRPSNREERQF